MTLAELTATLSAQSRPSVNAKYVVLELVDPLTREGSPCAADDRRDGLRAIRTHGAGALQRDGRDLTNPESPIPNPEPRIPTQAQPLVFPQLTHL